MLPMILLLLEPFSVLVVDLVVMVCFPPLRNGQLKDTLFGVGFG